MSGFLGHGGLEEQVELRASFSGRAGVRFGRKVEEQDSGDPMRWHLLTVGAPDEGQTADAEIARRDPCPAWYVLKERA